MKWTDEMCEMSRKVTRAREQDDLDEFIRILKESPTLLRDMDGSDFRLKSSAYHGQIPFIKALIELGLDINTPEDLSDDEPEGAIQWAAYHGHLETTRWMLDNGAKINYVVDGKPRCYSLLHAIQGGHFEIVKLLVEHGADIHMEGFHMNAVTEADLYGQFEIRDYLISKGAKHFCDLLPPDYLAAHKLFLERMQNGEDMSCEDEAESFEEEYPNEADGYRGFGPIDASWKLEIPGEPTVTIYTIPPNQKSKERVLFTVGLSDHNMQYPYPDSEQLQMYHFVELILRLPTDWQFDEKSLQKPRWNFPLEWMQKIVKEIRQREIWYRKPILFMNGDEPQPLAEGTEQSGWLCQVSDIIPPEFPDHREIMTFDLISIYKEEAKRLKQSENETDFNEFFDELNIPRIINPTRRNIAVD